MRVTTEMLSTQNKLTAMVVYTVFTKNVETLYKTSLCSKSTIFFGFITFWTLILPLLVAYRSQSFWVKTLSYREQPIVHFKNEYFLYIETNKGQDPVVCTTVRQQSENLSKLDRCTTIKFYEEDQNGDGKQDRLWLEMEVTTNEPIINVHSVYLVLAFDFVLQHHCLLGMESLIVIQSSVAFPAKKLHVFGDLELKQRALLACRGRDVRYNQSAFSDPFVNIDEMLLRHAKQNVSTKLGNKYYQWTQGEENKFNLELEVMYPEVTVHYRPGFWPVMKWAWIQYLAIFVIFWALGRWIKQYIFVNHLLPTVVYRPWKPLTNSSF